MITLRHTSLIFLPVAIMLLALACTKDVGAPVPQPVSSNPCDSVSYSRDVKAIVDAACTSSGCHVANGSAPGDLTGYAKTAEWALNGQFKLRVFEGFGRYMPPSGMLPEKDLEKLRCWMNAGAPNN